ncbi:MAG: hypothetical protein ACHQK9_17855, partial [Reyranellales bacterium]
TAARGCAPPSPALASRSASLPKPSPAAEWTARLALIVGSVLLTLVVLELGCRLAHGHYWLLHWPNPVLQERVDYDLRGRYVRDPLLGYVPRPNFHSAEINTDGLGHRVMPVLPADARDGPPVLATGDSFAYGLEAADAGTWPAQLQALVRRRTLNAAVAGYGLDQIVLRSEQQASLVRPALIVASFIPDDLQRSELRRLWSTGKPYFTLNGDGMLALHEAPTPQDMPIRQRMFGWSMLAATVLGELGVAADWMTGSERATPQGTAERLACPLMRRLARLGVPILIVAQYERVIWDPGNDAQRAQDRRLTAIVLGCAEAAGLASLDTFDVLDKAVRERSIGVLYGNAHHSTEGNRVIAQAIAAELERREMTPQ